MYNCQQFNYFTCDQWYLLLVIVGPIESLMWALMWMANGLPSFILKAESEFAEVWMM